MNSLQLELVKKKEKLAELKQRKIQREQLKSASTQTTTTAATHLHKQINKNNYTCNPANEFENLSSDQILTKLGLLGPEDLSESCSGVSVSVSSSSQSLKSNVSYTTLASSASNAFISCKSNNNSESLYESSHFTNNFENLKLTSDVNINIIDIYPNETIKYSKETQTTTHFDDEIKFNENEINNNSSGTDDCSDTPDRVNKKRGKHWQKPLAYYDDIFVYDTLQWEDEYVDAEEEFTALDLIEQELFSTETIGSIIKKALAVNSNDLENMINHKQKTKQKITTTADLAYDQEPANDSISENSNFQSSQIDSDNNFIQFLRQKRPIIERALKQNEKNIFFDYSAANTAQKILEESQKVLIKLKKSFCSTDKSSVITCLDWSQHYPELLLCSYDNMSFNYEEAASESTAVIWNSKSDQKVPYQYLTCSSLITSCIFSSYHPNLIIAGTYSGQIVMWDIRCNKQTPIQRSSLSISSHVNPVYCVKVVGNHDAQNLISISNDGKLCSWSLDNLNLPFETHDLCIKNASNKSVYATCFDFQNVPTTTTTSTNINATASQRYAIVGAEDGYAHSLLINSNNTTSNNNNKYSISDTFVDHLGPITGVSCYMQSNTAITSDVSWSKNNNYLSQLFLTCSFDGCIKLWNLMDNSSPIHTFECNGDYVYDVGWSPVHPALFACVDGSGKLDIWNLNNDFELPSATFELDNSRGARALNRLKWSRNGHEIAVGDDHGQITVFELNENFVRSSQDETKKFLSTLNTLKQMNHDSNLSDSFR